MSFIPTRHDLLHSDVDSYDIDQCKDIITNLRIRYSNCNDQLKESNNRLRSIIEGKPRDIKDRQIIFNSAGFIVREAIKEYNSIWNKPLVDTNEFRNFGVGVLLNNMMNNNSLSIIISLIVSIIGIPLSTDTIAETKRKNYIILSINFFVLPKRLIWSE